MAHRNFSPSAHLVVGTPPGERGNSGCGVRKPVLKPPLCLCLSCVLITSSSLCWWVRGPLPYGSEDDWTQDNWHWKDEIKNNFSYTYWRLCVTSSYTWRLAYHAGSHKACTQQQNKQSGAVGGRLCSIKWVECLLVPMGACGWLIWIILWAVKELKPTTQGETRTGLGSLDTEGRLVRTFLQMQSEERNLQWGHSKALPILPRQPIILNLNFRLYTTLWLWELHCHLIVNIFLPL